MIGKAGNKMPAFRFLMNLTTTITFDAIAITGYSNPQQKKA